MQDPRADGDRGCRHRRRLCRVSPRRAGPGGRPRDRPRAALRDRRVDLACTRAGLPDERVPHDVPDRTGFRPRCTPSSSVDGEPCWYGVGGIEVATSEARMAELQRRRGWARSYGIEDTELSRPSRRPSGSRCSTPRRSSVSYLVPSDGIAKGVRIAAALARRAGEKGVAFEGEVTVTGFDVRDGRVHGVLTDHGTIECERVLICAGSGGRRSERWPASRSRCSRSSTSSCGPTRSRSSPASRARSCTRSCATRTSRCTSGSARTTTASGSYHHEPIATALSDAPGARRRPAAGADAVHARATSTTRRPRPRAAPPGARRDDASGRPGSVAQRDVLVHAGRGLDRRRERAGPRRVDLRGRLGHARAGGWAGRSPSGWRRAAPATTWREADANRFYPFQTTPPYVLERGKQQYREVYDILHPLQQLARPRGLRLTPFHQRHVELGAEFFTGRRVGASAVVRRERSPERRCMGVAARAGPRRTGLPPSAPSTWRRANARRSSTSPRT